MSEIAALIKELAGKGSRLPLNAAFCEVVSVDEGALTCTVSVISSEMGIELSEVSLMPEITDGFVRIPAVESNVIVHYAKDMAPHIIMYGELSKVIAIVGDSGILIEPNKITLNKGDYGGLIKIENLVNRMNRIEEAVSELKAVHNSHTHAVSGGTASPTPNTATKDAGTTSRNELENKLIVHGSSL